MTYSPGDRERLQRIRDKQINARDPHAKRRRVDAKVAARRRITVKRFSVRDLTQTPHRFVWALIGGILGVLVVIFLPYFWDHPSATLVSIVALFFLIVLGFFIGRGLDTRDELKELIE
jgi:VIT1/CCC1 family predicted Fe2+/Mn2+ transporter